MHAKTRSICIYRSEMPVAELANCCPRVIGKWFGLGTGSKARCRHGQIAAGEAADPQRFVEQPFAVGGELGDVLGVQRHSEAISRQVQLLGRFGEQAGLVGTHIVPVDADDEPDFFRGLGVVVNAEIGNQAGDALPNEWVLKMLW